MLCLFFGLHAVQRRRRRKTDRHRREDTRRHLASRTVSRLLPSSLNEDRQSKIDRHLAMYLYLSICSSYLSVVSVCLRAYINVHISTSLALRMTQAEYYMQWRKQIDRRKTLCRDTRERESFCVSKDEEKNQKRDREKRDHESNTLQSDSLPFYPRDFENIRTGPGVKL